MRSVRAPRGITLLVLAISTCSVAAAAVGRQQRDPEEYAKFLEGAARVERMQVPRVIAALELKPGMKVADIGSGSGLFTRPIARAVAPGGLAYAVDVDEGLLRIVARSASEAGLSNVRTVAAAPDDPRLPELVDLAFICDTLYHIQNPGEYLKTLRKQLTPGARLAVIDFADQWPQGHESMRYSARDLDGWAKAAGFARIASHDWLENSFFHVYR